MNYFSTITFENGNYIGSVYTTNNNQLVYKTAPHPTQILATRDTNNYIQSNNNIVSTLPINSAETSIPKSPRRCCGR